MQFYSAAYTLVIATLVGGVIGWFLFGGIGIAIGTIVAFIGMMIKFYRSMQQQNKNRSSEQKDENDADDA